MRIKQFRWIESSRGSITIESSLLFPIIFVITLVLIFGSLFVYQKASLYYAAGVTAERTAYSWDNSYKNHMTGSFVLGQNDGLYWRIMNDSVSDMFGFVVPNQPTTLNIPSHFPASSLSGPQKKLQLAANQLTEGMKGSITYVNELFDRRIEVQLRNSFHIPLFATPFLAERMSAQSSSRIIEPTEYIRSIDMIRSYAVLLKERGISKQQASEALHEFLNKKSPSSFSSHKEAHPYLNRLVGGIKTEFTTSYGIRKVDALDDQGISHQAYVTFNERQIRSQMVKDVELLLKGEKVKGVVWHFFRKTNQTGRVGPSDKLRSELEKNGIVVIVHD